MTAMKKAFLVYCITFILLQTVVLGMLYAYPKLELHLMLNTCHTAIADTFFKYYTLLAEWPLYVLALLPVFWKKSRMTLFFAISELSSGAVLQTLKRLFEADRPVSVFASYPDVTLPLVQGVDMHHSNSFPSGHASTFFVFFTCCALLLAYYYQQRANAGKPCSQLLITLSMLSLLFLAALGAYSRVYLSQHFMEDICVGSIIGFIVPCLVFHFFRNKILSVTD